LPVLVLFAMGLYPDGEHVLSSARLEPSTSEFIGEIGFRKKRQVFPG
jgi:hypothetical protein